MRYPNRQKYYLIAGVSSLALALTINVAYAQELGSEGFAIVVDGNQTAGDANFQESKYSGVIAATLQSEYVPKETKALDNAKISVRFDGFDVKPALDLNLSQNSQGLVAKTYSNYPAFLERGTIIAYKNINGRIHQIGSADVRPNATTTIDLPSGEGISYVYRVYDRQGHYDQTHLTQVGPSRDMSEGNNGLERQNIPVFGGAVTVNAEDAQPGAKMLTMGENLEVPAGGELVVERILPPGEYDIGVDYQSQDNRANVSRRINIAEEDWFYVGVVDATLGQYLETNNEVKAGDTYNSGRTAFFARGRVKGDYLITLAADTGEGKIEEIFQGFDQKDAKSIISRIDPDEYYTVYGDNSVSEEFAPTSGKFYIRVDRGKDYAMWGNFNANINGSNYVRNDRKLYGATAHSEIGVQENGQPIVQLDAYAAQPERLSGRDAFLGTGGSVYFLRRQDISTSSETLMVEFRDKDTGRVIERKELVAGRDYEINYTQGLITLNKPLSSSGSENYSGDKSEAVLVAQYEYTPTGTSVSDLSYGGRVATNLTNNMTIGTSYLSEQQGVSKQELAGADITIRAGENSYVKAEYAESRGPGFGYSLSKDGGLSVKDVTNQDKAQKGSATKVDIHADFGDFNQQLDGWVDAYYESRKSGFTNPDYITNGDTVLYGAKATFATSQNSSITASIEHAENPNKGKLNKQGVSTRGIINEQFETEIYARREDLSDEPNGKNGSRSEVGGKLTYKVNDSTSVYALGKATVENEGAYKRDNRYGIGATYKINEVWSLNGEVTNGDLGLGADVNANYNDGKGNQSYIGYRLDPERRLGDEALIGADSGQLVIGSRNIINEDASTFVETRYDMFGEHRSLGQAYGLDYKLGENWNFDGAYENARETSKTSDFQRNALSLGVKYNDGEKAALTLRGEYRTDKGTIDGQKQDQQSTLISLKSRYEVDPSVTYFGSLAWMRVWDSPLATKNGDYIDARIGYAYRPVTNDRLNSIVDYRYINDDLGQIINGDAKKIYKGMHLASVDTRYDIDGYWDVGGKIAYRDAFGQDENGKAVHNRAYMFAPSIRYNISHEWEVSGAHRFMYYQDANLWDQSSTLAVYRHLGDNMKLGVGYNFGKFTDDLTNLNESKSSVFFNIVADF